MSGFDKSKFLDFPKCLEEELSCGICLNILNNPMTTPCCRHSYCNQCINQWLSRNKTCPNDRKSLIKPNLIQSSRIVINLLDKQEVYCDFRTDGCPQIVQLSQLSQHLVECSFDPNKAHDKCDQILRNLESSVDRLNRKNKNPNLCQDLQQLKSQIGSCRNAIKSLNSKQSDKNTDFQFIPPNSDSYRLKIIESAKSKVESPQVISFEMSEGLKQKIIKKSKEAIIRFDNYKDIAQHLVNQLNNDAYDWSAFVYPINSMNCSIGKYNFKIELSFGDLSILMVSRLRDEESDGESESGSDQESNDSDDQQTYYYNDYRNPLQW